MGELPLKDSLNNVTQPIAKVFPTPQSATAAVTTDDSLNSIVP